MFKNMKLSAKLGMGFGVLVVIIAVLGFFGWQGATQMGKHMAAFSEWSTIDAEMNEGVTQACLVLDQALVAYKADPTEATWQVLNDEFDEVHQGLEQWRGLVAHVPDLVKAVGNIKEELRTYRKVVDGYQTTFKVQAESEQKWDQLTEACFAYLWMTVEEVIDPAKEMFEKVEDVPQMVKWGAIDMVMNEAVIARFLKLQTAAHDYAADGSTESWDAFLAAQRATEDGLAEWREVLKGETKMEAAAEKVESYLAEYASLGNSYHEAYTKLQGLEERMAASSKSLYAELDHAMEEVPDPAKDAVEAEARAAERQVTTVAIILAVCGVILGIVLAFLITRSITKPITKAIEQLGIGSDQVSSASSQVASSSQQMAEGASEQASSLEETTASLQEMASMSRQNADNAKEANTLASSGATEAEKGNEAMSRMSAAIEDIKKSSDETAKIIKTIDEIAFQTNLLALNAAVEAARAGEAGKGFAVVAEEVRNLAQRSAEAARNTSNLIEESQKNADNGVQVSQEVASSLSSIATSIQKVTGLVSEISAASDEQAKGVEQINEAMTQMDKVTQENAANAEESASASEELNAQAEELKVVVEQLQKVVVGEGSTISTGAAARTHAGWKQKKTTWDEKKERGVKDRIHGLLHKGESHVGEKPGKARRSVGQGTAEDLIPLEEADFKDAETAAKA